MRFVGPLVFAGFKPSPQAEEDERLIGLPEDEPAGE